MLFRPTLQHAVVLTWLGSFALAAPVQARDFHVNASTGVDASACISSPGSSNPCKTISYVINNTTLESDTVHVQGGTYYENVSIGTSDGGSSDSTRVRFVGEGGTVTLTGLDPNPLNDSTFVACTAAVNCAGDGRAFANTHKIDISGRTVLGVYETVWKPLRIDDAGVTNVVFDFTESMSYKPKSSVAEVDALNGSYFLSGTTLYVHTFFNENPRTANLNVETRLRSNYGVAISGSFVDFNNFDLRYFDNGIQLSGVSIRVDKIKVYSGNGIGLDMTDDTSDCVVTNVDVSNVYRRKAADDSWVNYAGGTGFNIKGTRHTLRTLTGVNSWNVFSGTMTNTLVDDVLVKNTPNHTFILSNTPSQNDCRDNIIRRSIAFNGQDQFFIRGCQNVTFVRNMGDVFVDDGAVTNNNDSTNWKLRGNNLKRIYVGSLSASGFSSNYNWLDDDSGNHCRRANDIRNCAAPWQQLGYDSQSNYGNPALVNASWPLPNGYLTSLKNRGDLVQSASSSMVDAGDPDIDGDGVLETAPGGDDECTAAHWCSGTRPDIGPFELGMSTPPPPPSQAPPPPQNVQRGDTR